MFQETRPSEFTSAEEFQFSIHGDMANLAAWTEVEPGRFMPRRVRGSFQGRALG
jgi:hypothetical protein